MFRAGTKLHHPNPPSAMNCSSGITSKVPQAKTVHRKVGNVKKHTHLNDSIHSF